MQTKVQMWGNSLALRIPKTYAADLCLIKGTVIDISESAGKIIIKPAGPGQKPSLQQLLAGITKENIHSEVDTGEPVGNEIW